MKMDLKKKFFNTGLPAAGMLIYLMFIFATNLFHFNYNMNSDIASDVILGELIWSSREWIPASWYIAMETRIICTPNVAALFNGLTGNMVFSMGVACCIMTAAILGGIYFFLRKLDMQKYWWWMGFIILLLPCGFASLEILYLFAGYYAIHVVVLFVTLGIYAGTLKSRKYKFAELLLGIILAILLGAQGARGLLVIYGPLCSVEIIRSLYLLYSRQRITKLDRGVSSWIAILLIANFAGMCLPFSTGHPLSSNIRGGFLKLWTVVIPDVGRAIGFSYLKSWGGKASLLLFLLLAVYELFIILTLMIRKREVTTAQWIYLSLFASPIITAFLVSFTTTESSERYYFVFLPVMAFASLLGWKECRIKWQIVFAIAAIWLALVNAFAIYKPILTSKEPPDTEAYEVVNYLCENRIETACATFENANRMTVLSGGNVKVRPVASVDRMNICKWMSSEEWYPPHVPYEQTTAYIITDNEMQDFEIFRNLRAAELYELCQIGKYHIFAAEYNFSTLE